MQSGIKYSEDVIPVSDLKVNPGRIIDQVGKTNRPVLVTSRGRGVAIVESLKDYTHESMSILGHDERDAVEFVDIFLRTKRKKVSE